MNTLPLHKQLDQIISNAQKGQKKPTLLLHCCCAPCSSAVLEYITNHFDVTVYFYNPNIYPETEYNFRLEEFKRLLCEQPHPSPVTFLEARYDPQEFFRIAKGLEQIPEGGQRCRRCFQLRLESTAEKAAQGHFDYFTTTLSISPLKNAAVLYECAVAAGQKYGVTPLPSDFKKRDGYKRSIELSALYHLYRQNYCGCVFSKVRNAHSQSERHFD